MTALVIVESPAKAKTIRKILGDDYIVEASIGHIRDLPRKAADIPEALKKEKWVETGINIDDGFSPLYIIPKEKKDQIKKLKDALKQADVLYLATDEDREGESISWHLVEVLKPQIPYHRLVFHEITESAVKRALLQTRNIDQNLVEAQETRRVLDRLFGYTVSPFLWKKTKLHSLSAGRVQSVALRMVVEREQERIKFVPAGWWDLQNEVVLRDDFVLGQGKEAYHKHQVISSKIRYWDGKRIADGSSFNDRGELTKKDQVVLNEKTVHEIISTLQKNQKNGTYAVVESREETSFSEKPQAPFITSSLQQEAIKKLRWTAKRTMSVAQKLYENGWITYMRTDSTTLSSQAITAARSFISSDFGSQYLPKEPRKYASKSKNAQEAHEAIRPSGDSFRHYKQAYASLGVDEGKLYELIWRRTVASQMKNALGERVRIYITHDKAKFSAGGRTYIFDGYRKAYARESVKSDKDSVIPPLKTGDVLHSLQLNPKDHQTKPPARLTEASLVKSLEEHSIGRPSTYASIIDTIIRRGYVIKKGTALIPSFTAFIVMRILEEQLNWLVDYDFTSEMEDRLDKISNGALDRLTLLKRFYHGDEGLVESINVAIEALHWSDVCFILGKDAQEQEIRIRVGRHGAYVERNIESTDKAKTSKGNKSQDTLIAFLPKDISPDELTVEKAIEFLEEKEKGPTILGADPESKKDISLQKGPYGYYVQIGEVEEVPKKSGKGTKKIYPKRASLHRGMLPQDIDLALALKLLSLPYSIGKSTVEVEVKKDDGTKEKQSVEEEVIANYGRFGPYIQRGKSTCSLPATVSIFDVTLKMAEEYFNDPSKSKSATKNLGENAEGKTVRIKNGRFGPYITDGKINAAIPKTLKIDEVDLKKALELLEAKAKAPPKKKKAAKKTTAKKTTTKKPATKKTTAKKTTAKKTTAKKTTAKKTTTKKPATKKTTAKKTTAKKTTAKKTTKK
jgi:DNA topoisomerase I